MMDQPTTTRLTDPSISRTSHAGATALASERTMHAIVHDRYGTPDVLTFTDVDRPGISDDEVLVRVRAASRASGANRAR